MNRKDLKIAVDEAGRFLRRAKAAQDNWPEHEFLGNKETGAVRRASMDLTRALADLRRRPS